MMKHKGRKMLRKKLKFLGFMGLLSSVLVFNACTPQEEALAVGVGVGAVVASEVYDYPRYEDRPYYYYRGRYYYGGNYRNGYYYYRGHRYRYGHYYRDGYRYYNGRRYRARAGRYGYYPHYRKYQQHAYRDNVYQKQHLYRKNLKEKRYRDNHTHSRHHAYDKSQYKRGQEY